jgi:hypothetical protein
MAFGFRGFVFLLARTTVVVGTAAMTVAVTGRTAIVSEYGFEFFVFLIVHFPDTVGQVQHLSGSETVVSATVVPATTMECAHQEAEKEQAEQDLGRKEGHRAHNQTADNGFYNCSCHLICISDT